MDHWFDRMTKFLAGGALSRREALKTGALAGGVFLFPKSSWLQNLLGGPQKLPRLAEEGPCIHRNLRGEHVTTVSASTNHKGQPLTFHSTQKKVGGHFGPGMLRQRIELGGMLVHELTFRFVPGFDRRIRDKKKRTAVVLGWAHIRNGPAIHGPRNIILKLMGDQVEGFADGRAISSHRRTELIVNVDPDLQSSIKELVRSAHVNTDSCRSIAPPRASLSRSEFLRMRPLSYKSVPLNPATGIASAKSTKANPELAAMQGGDACQQCENHCDIQATACGITSLGEVIADPLALLTLGGCVYNYWSCENGCTQQGGPCCSVQCESDICCGAGQFCCTGQTAPACCDNGSVCVAGLLEGFYEYAYCCPGGSDPAGCQAMDSGGFIALYCRQPNQVCCGVFWACGAGQQCGNAEYGICCPTGQVACAGNCCNGTCITSNPGTSSQTQVCCPSGSNVCGGTSCCAPGQSCLTSPSGKKVCCAQPLCGEQCCTGGAVCNNGQCGFGQPCGNTFCGFGTVCCNGTCCASCCNNNCCPGSDDTCIRGQCCPRQQSCGKICCPSGQFCSNGKCVTGCPNGTDISQAPDGTLTCCPLYQCDNPSNDNICVAASCPGGVCCGQNQVCCPGRSAGQYFCANPPCPPNIQ